MSRGKPYRVLQARHIPSQRESPSVSHKEKKGLVALTSPGRAVHTPSQRESPSVSHKEKKGLVALTSPGRAVHTIAVT